MDEIQNPGSALGEAIGANMECVLNEYLPTVVDKYSCRIISKGCKNIKTKKETKLLLSDQFGTKYNIDAVVANEAMQPLILLEYKYIRYTKHNRDKGSWLCTAHNAVRKRYNSIRSSIAILAGNWSQTSLAMMKSHSVNLFVIPFSRIVELLSKYGIVFDWDEKDRETALESWKKYAALSPEQKKSIAQEMIVVIKEDLEKLIEKILDNQSTRSLEKILIEIHSNLGEVRYFEFDKLDDAINFLEDFSIEEILDHSNSFTLFDTPNLPEEN